MTLRQTSVPLDASAIAGAEALAVANIDTPTELNSIAGTVAGEKRLCYQVAAGDDAYTIYAWEAANSGGVDAPYVMAGSSGFWVAVGGKYVNSSLTVNGSLASIGTVQGTRLISTVATGTAPLTVASTTVVANLNADTVDALNAADIVQIAGSQTISGAKTFSTGIVSTATGALLSASAATTSTRYARIANTTGDFYFGVESSVAGSFFTGSEAYDAACYTPGKLYLAGFTGIRMNPGASGTVTVGAVSGTATPTVNIAGGTSGSGTATLRMGTVTREWDIGVAAGSAYTWTLGYAGTDAPAPGIVSLTKTGLATLTCSDAATDTQPAALTIKHLTSATPVSGFGVTASFESETTVASRQMYYIQCDWNSVTDATRTAKVGHYVCDSGGARLALQMDATGTAAKIGFLGAAASVRTAITGSRGGNAALAALLTELAAKGLITDSTTA